MTTELPTNLVNYLAVREQQRADEMAAVLQAMTPREVQMVREAAIMGYVRGHMAGRAQESAVPKDSAILVEVLDAIFACPDLYPVINLLREEVQRERAARRSQ